MSGDGRDPIPRLLPGEPLPARAYTPGLTPRPAEEDRPATPPCDPPRWRDCHAYLRGIDLFNHGFYWEAHEAWEEVWNGLGRKGPAADLMKALIALAAAGVKVRQRRPRGVASHAARAAALLDGLAGTGPRLMGLDLTPVARAAAALAASPPDWDGARIALPFRLLPA
ncbi:MAG: DUF309 domain-containing protein [Alphaproteobacteria bacterium]|nr:DUF309 domain-containing protein [Alphaproteobacteria bacterium]